MSDRIFFDSNVILYAFFRNDGRSAVAERVLACHNAVISSQVVGEVCTNLRKKAGFSPQEIAMVATQLYAGFDVCALEEAHFLLAASLLDRFSLSFWDAMIVAAALRAGCTILYSEDMHHGLRIDAMTILNPFSLQ